MPGPIGKLDDQIRGKGSDTGAFWDSAMRYKSGEEENMPLVSDGAYGMSPNDQRLMQYLFDMLMNQKNNLVKTAENIPTPTSTPIPPTATSTPDPLLEEAGRISKRKY